MSTRLSHETRTEGRVSKKQRIATLAGLAAVAGTAACVTACAAGTALQGTASQPVGSQGSQAGAPAAGQSSRQWGHGGSTDNACTFYLADGSRDLFMNGWLTHIAAPGNDNGATEPCPAYVTFAGDMWRAVPEPMPTGMQAQFESVVQQQDSNNQDCQGWNNGNYSSENPGLMPDITNTYSLAIQGPADGPQVVHAPGVSDATGDKVCAAWVTGSLPLIGPDGTRPNGEAQ